MFKLQLCWIFAYTAASLIYLMLILLLLQALKEEASSSVDLLGGPMGPPPGNNASRSRNLSLSPRANKFIQEKRAVKSPKQDNSAEEIERIKGLFQAACTR